LNLLGEPALVAKAASGALPAHSTSYTYDAADRKWTETNDGRTVTYSYDASGNRSTTTWPDSYYVSYTYDALDRMQFVRENSLSTNELAYYTYDALSRRISLCMGAGTASCASTAWTNNVGYGYEPLDGQLNTLTHQLNATTVSFGFMRNHSYQMTTLSASDGFYLPTPASAASVSYVPNALDEYASVGGQTLTYDLNGNLLTWFPSTGQHTYTYDSENRLSSAAVAGSATPSIFYDYDALGRRISKTTGGTGVGVGGVTTGYLLDGDEEIAEYNVSAGVWSLARRYVTGPAVDDRIAHAEGSATANPTKTYYHADHQGSVIDMTDNAGNVVQRIAYDEYGNLPAGSNGNTGEQFQYAGRRYDPETGLYYYRARYYAPQLGRFLQVDPVGYRDALNLYAYVGNDPLDKTDPTGTSCVTTTDDSGSVHAQSCRIDKDRDKLVKKYGEEAVKKLENSMTSAVNKLLAHPNETDSVTVDIVDKDKKRTGQTVSAYIRAGDLANNLIKRQVGYDPDSNKILETSRFSDETMYVGGNVGKLLSWSLLDTRSWTADLEAEREKAWTHEAMHTKSVHDQLGPRDTWDQFHSEPFQQAAFRILGLDQKQ
jgi:RHS repeat-associated protein